MKLPKNADIWPLFLIHAQDTKHAGAVRLHVLASALDHGPECDHVFGKCRGGSGRIETAVLLEAAQSLKVKRSTFYSWLADARQAGILRGVGKYLFMAGQEELSRILLCNSIDEHKAIIPLKKLFKPGWKVWVWAAYTKANHSTRVGYNKKLQPVYKGNQISAAKLEALTGVPKSTQRRLNKLVKRRRNIAITTTNGTLEGMYEHRDRPGKFLFVDPNQDNRRVIAFNIPATRTVKDEHAKIGARGHRRQIQAAISKSLRLVQVCNYPTLAPVYVHTGRRPRQAGTLKEGFTPYPRLFHETPKQIEMAEKGYLTRNRPPACLRSRKQAKSRAGRYGVGVWDALIIQTGALGTSA